MCFFDVMFSECVQMHFLRKKKEKEEERRRGGEAVETGFSLFCLEL